MTTFNQWHEEDKNTFHSEEFIFFSSCGINKKIHLSELLKIVSDVAVEDYNQRGLSREFLAENRFGILVSRCSFRFHNMPGENQRISVKTWEEKPEALQLCRAYEIKDENENLLVTGDSSWLLVDLNSRRLIPSQKLTVLRPAQTIKIEKDCLKPGKITIPEDINLLSEHKIGYSDLDANGHTNNGQYARFIEDALPMEYMEKTFTDFRINFSKEATYNQTLKIFAKIDDEAKKISIAGKTENETSFEAELFWK